MMDPVEIMQSWQDLPSWDFQMPKVNDFVPKLWATISNQLVLVWCVKICTHGELYRVEMSFQNQIIAQVCPKHRLSLLCEASEVRKQQIKNIFDVVTVVLIL